LIRRVQFVFVAAGQCYNMTPLIDQELEKIDRYAFLSHSLIHYFQVDS